MDDLFCDLCKNPCNGPVRYAHRPYMFRFYHEEEYERQVKKFVQRNIEIDEDLDEGSIKVDTEDEEETGCPVEHISNASQLSDWTNAELYEVDELEDTRGALEDEKHITEGNEFVNSELFDVRQEENEEKKNTGHKIWKDGVEREYRETNLYDIEEEDEEENMHQEFAGEDWEDVEVFEEDDEFLDDQWENDQVTGDMNEDVYEYLPSSAFITIIANHSKSLINRHLDITIATSGAIMTALANINEHTQDVTKAYSSIAVATVGIAVGMKGLLTAARPHQPTLPQCKNCKNIPHPKTGCRPFCHLCGECDPSSNWKDGSRENHCLVICKSCDKTCVLCETNIATVRTHHKDFCTNVHGDASTRLSGGCRNGGIVGSSLLMAGVITCAAIPGKGWGMGAALIAGSILVCGAVRVSSSLPNLRIRCHICHEEEGAEYYVCSEGCQSWCMCCGVFTDGSTDVGGRYCLQLCDDCTISHD